ncbi:hypothetical protein B296_00013230, partial [Ensete ventricosum]
AASGREAPKYLQNLRFETGFQHPVASGLAPESSAINYSIDIDMLEKEYIITSAHHMLSLVNNKLKFSGGRYCYWQTFKYISCSSNFTSKFYISLIDLEKYRKLDPRLPVTVAETLLYTDPQIELPLWLVHMFKRPADIINRKKMSATWFPYIAIERLWCQLEEMRSSGHMVDHCDKLKKLLQEAMMKHLKQVGQPGA